MNKKKDELFFVEGGLAQHDGTKRWHALIRCDGAMAISNQSFATEHEALDYLKQWADKIGGTFEMIQ